MLELTMMGCVYSYPLFSFQGSTPLFQRRRLFYQIFFFLSSTFFSTFFWFFSLAAVTRSKWYSIRLIPLCQALFSFFSNFFRAHLRFFISGCYNTTSTLSCQSLFSIFLKKTKNNAAAPALPLILHPKACDAFIINAFFGSSSAFSMGKARGTLRLPRAVSSPARCENMPEWKKRKS